MKRFIIVTDVDGTVMDAMHSYTEAFSSILLKLGIPKKLSEEYFSRSAGTELKSQFEQILKASKNAYDDPSVKSLMDKFWETQKNISPKIYQDVIPSLSRLKGYEIHMVSGTRHDVLDDRIKKAGMDKYLRKWVGWSDKYSKRDHLKSLSGKTVIYIGDGVSDMEMAKEFSLIGVGIVREGSKFSKKDLKEAGAAFVVSGFKEFMDIVKEIESSIKLIIVRHGETEDNVNGIVQGHRHGKLTGNGIEQSKRLALRLKNESIDRIFCSDLARAKDTVMEIVKFHKVHVEYTEKLRERSLGKYEGKGRAEMLKGFEGKGYFGTITDPDFSPKGVESYGEFKKRAVVFLNGIEGAMGKTILLCTHGGFGRMLIGSALGLDDVSIAEIQLGNASVSVIFVSRKNAAIERINDTSHLETTVHEESV